MILQSFASFEESVGRDAFLDRPEELMLYEYDAGVDKGPLLGPWFSRKTQSKVFARDAPGQ